MDAAAREKTEDWVLRGDARPPLIGELERRVEQALATARASEAAVMTVGAAALDAADQARHAAQLAARASGAALAAQGRVESITVAPIAATQPETARRARPADESLSDFSARADRLVARLRQLQRVPLATPPASDASGRPQPAR